MEELRARAGGPGFPEPLLVHPGSPEEGEAFFASRWPEARAVSDPEGGLYEAFGIGRGSARQLVGPRALAAWLKAVLSGHGFGKPAGDPRRMSGWFLVHDRRIVWSHVHEHAGAPRRWGELEASCARLAETA